MADSGVSPSTERLLSNEDHRQTRTVFQGERGVTLVTGYVESHNRLETGWLRSKRKCNKSDETILNSSKSDVLHSLGGQVEEKVL